ncbi:hypothetical protein SCLCIDRAFT_1224618 [Scleroderma citrinum Foug A]|uniref:Uncharacterized protein n=1 Tax=Scleroderma citrinum Foug A TaxID=1036808 RepID=A0A0C3CRW4_9AGAM|nr:hypothetical protein SCLCIDRAFT_1224618 [Scleroderma citrinum Foug A]
MPKEDRKTADSKSSQLHIWVAIGSSDIVPAFPLSDPGTEFLDQVPAQRLKDPHILTSHLSLSLPHLQQLSVRMAGHSDA